MFGISDRASVWFFRPHKLGKSDPLCWDFPTGIFGISDHACWVYPTASVWKSRPSKFGIPDRTCLVLPTVPLWIFRLPYFGKSDHSLGNLRPSLESPTAWALELGLSDLPLGKRRPRCLESPTCLLGMSDGSVWFFRPFCFASVWLSVGCSMPKRYKRVK